MKNTITETPSTLTETSTVMASLCYHLTHIDCVSHSPVEDPWPAGQLGALACVMHHVDMVRHPTDRRFARDCYRAPGDVSYGGIHLNKPHLHDRLGVRRLAYRGDRTPVRSYRASLSSAARRPEVATEHTAAAMLAASGNESLRAHKHE